MSNRGFALIDVIIGVSLLTILFVGLMGTLRASLEVSALARSKSASLGLLESQMEYLHTLPYDALGTLAGDPAGAIPADATSTLDGADYGVHTAVRYTDAHDAKVAEVSVTSYGKSVHTLSLVATFAP